MSQNRSISIESKNLNERNLTLEVDSDKNTTDNKNNKLQKKF